MTLRVASLLPAATEIVAALGCEGALTGVSHECDHPESIRRLPRLTRTRLPGEAGAARIHRDMGELIEQALSIFEVDAPALRHAAPDVVVTQTQCSLCAVSPADLTDALAAWTGGNPRVVSLEATTLSGVLDDMRRVAEALGRPQSGDTLVRRLRHRFDRVRERADACGHRPSVGVIEWLSPMMAAGNWIPELLELAGCRPCWGETGEHSPWLSEQELISADPDILLIIPCGYRTDRTREELHVLTELAVWPELRAVRNGRVFVCDGNAYFNRPGPRLAESLEMVLEIAHREKTDNSLKVNDWVHIV